MSPEKKLVDDLLTDLVLLPFQSKFSDFCLVVRKEINAKVLKRPILTIDEGVISMVSRLELGGA